MQGGVFQLRRRNALHLGQRTAGADLNIAAVGGQKEVDVFPGEGPPLVVEDEIRLPGAEQLIQLLMAAADHRHLRIRVLFGEKRQRPVKLRAGIAAQIPDSEACPAASGDFGGFAAHPLVVRREKQALLVEIRPGRRQGKAAVSAFLQRKAQFPLQRLHLLGDGGLGDEVFLRCRGKAVEPDNCLKGSELFEHGASPALKSSV